MCRWWSLFPLGINTGKRIAKLHQNLLDYSWNDVTYVTYEELLLMRLLKLVTCFLKDFDDRRNLIRTVCKNFIANFAIIMSYPESLICQLHITKVPQERDHCRNFEKKMSFAESYNSCAIQLSMTLSPNWFSHAIFGMLIFENREKYEQIDEV